MFLKMFTGWYGMVCIVALLIVSVALPCFAGQPGISQPVGSAYPGVLYVATIPEGWPPYIVPGKDGPDGTTGIMFDVLREVALRTGISLKIVEYPEVRAVSQLAEGRIHAFPKDKGWVAKPDEFLWTDPVIELHEVVITRKGERAWCAKDLLQESGVKVGTIHGFRYPQFEEVFAKGGLKREDSGSMESMLCMLMHGRVDAAISNPNVAQWTILQHSKFTDKFQFGNPDDSPCLYRFAFTKNSGWEAYIPRFNRVLQQMKEEGAVQRIIDRYSTRSAS